MALMGQAFGGGLSSVRRRVISSREEEVAMGVSSYYVLTKADTGLPNSKLHPNSGAPDYDVVHNVSDLVFTSIKKTVCVSAAAGMPRVTNGCLDAEVSETTTNKVNYYACAFSKAADNYWQAHFPLPKNYDAGTFTARIRWIPDADTTSGGVAWFVQALAVSNDDALDAAFGDAVEIDDTWTAAGDLHVTADSAAVTASGTPVGGDELWIQIYRDVDDAADTLTGGTNNYANLVGIEIAFGIDELSTED